MSSKKRTPSNTSASETPKKSPSKAATPVPLDIPPTSPVTPSKQSPKKHVKIHPEAQVETYVVGEPMQTHDNGHGKSEKSGTSPTKESPKEASLQQGSKKLVKQESEIETVVIDEKLKSKPTSGSPVKSASLIDAPKVKSVKEKHSKSKYYRDEATIQADNEELENEISKYISIGSRFWNENTMIIVPEKEDRIAFDAINDYCKATPNRKRSEVFAAHGNYNYRVMVAFHSSCPCLSF